MEIKSGDKVITADGKFLGRIDRIVVDPTKNLISDLVVRKGVFFREDKVIPYDWVAGNDENQIRLESKEIDWDSLPNFEESQYIQNDEPWVDQAGNPTGISSSFWVPPMPPAGGFLIPGTGIPAAPVNPNPEQKPIEQIHENIPEGTVAIKEGTKVTSIDEQNIGKVDSLVTSLTNQQLTHLVVSQGTFLKERKAVPVGWVAQASEDEIQLSVKAKIVEKLPSYSVS